MKKPSDRLLNSVTANNLWLYVCKLLLEEQMFAREIQREIVRRFGLRTNLITVYSVLYRLQRGGYIRRTGNYRKYYRITEKGVEEFEKGVKLIEKTLKVLTGE